MVVALQTASTARVGQAGPGDTMQHKLMPVLHIF